jgi:hypothetical protein
MVRRIVALITACLYLFTWSCGSSKLVSPGGIKDKKDHINAVVLTSGDVIEFDPRGGRLNRDEQVVRGTTKDGKEVTLAFSDIVSATVERTSGGGVAGTIGIVFIALIVLLAIMSNSVDHSSSGSSCPYVYSFDGSDYILDAEPLSGAISKGLERNDVCRLDHVRAHDGRYELLVRNELQETQYLDAIKLHVVDHPQGSQAYTDTNGAIHVMADAVGATDAHDERGVDLRALIKSEDTIPWQSIMPIDDTWKDVSLRNELTFSFPKPADATRGNLIVRAATSQWGSIMMREMMQARGNRLEAWRHSVDAGGPAMAEMVRFNMREELYFLKLYVREGDQWVQRGWIPGGGPMAPETRVIPVDLSGVMGDTVTIRVQPPRGYWAFDYLAMSYRELPAPTSTIVPLERALLSDGSNATASMSVADGTYHEMQHVGDSMVLTFAAPRTPAEGVRTVFLDTRGYYHSQIDEKQPEQSALIAKMLENNGAITRYSLQKFVEFASQTASAGGSRQ